MNNSRLDPKRRENVKKGVVCMLRIDTRCTCSRGNADIWVRERYFIISSQKKVETGSSNCLERMSI
jgi:hypothetical protein